MKYVLASIVSLTLVLISCVTAPGTNRKQLNFIPEETMNQNGEAAYRELIGQSKISKNASLNSEIVAIGRRIAQASGVNYDWEFTVIDEDQVNAFCLPGGKVGVYTGIIPVAKNNAGLAAVMGHEVAHAVLRHSGERASQQMVMQVGLAGTAWVFSDSRFRDQIAAVMGVGAMYGLSLPFSRFHESEADRVGLEYMAKAGYDPREAVHLWERMAQQGERSPELLSTHPDPASRAKDLEKRMSGAMAIYNAAIKQPTRNL